MLLPVALVILPTVGEGGNTHTPFISSHKIHIYEITHNLLARYAIAQSTSKFQEKLIKSMMLHIIKQLN